MELEGGCGWDMKEPHRWDEQGLGQHTGHSSAASIPPVEGYLLVFFASRQAPPITALTWEMRKPLSLSHAPSLNATTP